MRALEQTVGVISVDPSSPFTQGALLGDRIRLTDHFLDPGVFIRSMGTRGHLGGLAEATLQAMLVLDAAGKDLIFLETVGAGQSEVEVIGIADTVVLVLMPGSGDSVQALKAGIMEIPDVIAINKMDHPAAKTMLNEVRSILSLGPRARLAAADRAHRGDARRERARAVGEGRGASGVPRGRRASSSAGGGATSPARCSRSRPARAKAHLERAVADDPELRRLLDEVQRRELDPLTAVREILEKVFHVDDTGTAPTLADIEAARERIAGIAKVTPVHTSETFSRLAGRAVYLKAENLQRTGSFKIRGAVNTIALLSDAERAAGVVAASAGNHGQAVAWAAREAGDRRDDLHAARRADGEGRGDAALRRGDRVVRGDASRRRSTAAQAFAEETGATFVHAFEDERVIAGQGTLGLELAEQAARRSRRSSCPSAAAGSPPGSRSRSGRCGRRCASSASRRRRARRSPAAAEHGFTIADGIAVKQPGELTSAILARPARRRS